MNTDIVIPIRSSAQFPTIHLFDRCARSVESHTDHFRFIFVDDNSTYQDSEEIARICSRYEQSLYIRTHFQHWFTRAVNIGLRLVRTPYAVVLNCDTVVDTGWLEELYAVKDEVEKNVGKVGLVGSILSGEEPRRYALSVGQDYVTGHCWLLNMQAMQEVSNFRSTPGWYLDELRADTIHIRSDVYICWDLNHLGWSCVKSFKSAVGHIGGQSWGQILGMIPPSIDYVNYKY
jgi:glycosyltransferase involved in cell wall biosynthesis